MSDFNTRTTHDLWVEAREFEVVLSRPTATTIQIEVSYPTSRQVAEGAVVLLGTKALSVPSYPQDGERYTPSTDLLVPADDLYGMQVVGFYSQVLALPLPGAPNPLTGKSTFSITVTGAADVLYYASVHAASNILQYYPIGVQSYPLEASRIERDSSTYTGNIPSLPSAPTSPSLGMVYHDTGLNIVQFWTGSQWIPTRADSILSGTVNPGALGQTYFLTNGAKLRIFDGLKWVNASSANLQLLAPGPTWIPLNAQSSGVKLPENPLTGEFLWNLKMQSGK